MKKFLTIALILAAAALAQEAEQTAQAQAPAAEKPVWILDETNCEPSLKYSTKAWYGDGKTMPLFKAAEGGGFVSSSPATRFLTLLPDHWLVLI